MAARFEFPNPPHTRPCRLERVHTPTAHLFRKCSNGAFCTSKQHISPRRNDRVRPHTRGGRPHRSGARPTARPQQQQQHQQPQHQQQTAAQQQHHKFARSEHHNIGRSNQPTAAGSRGANCVVTTNLLRRGGPFGGHGHVARGTSEHAARSTCNAKATLCNWRPFRGTLPRSRLKRRGDTGARSATLARAF